MIWTTRERRALVAMLIAFLALGAVYSVVTPVFEAGDELWHYPFVQYLATGHGLPVQDPQHKELWEQEGGQPPLYYALAAAATFWIDTHDLPDRLWRNPYAKVGIPLAFGSKNLIVHTAAEDFPWHNTALAVHLARLLSLLLSAITVWMTYLLARELAFASQAARPGWAMVPFAAAALVAFNPMFLFIGSSVNNDNLATALAAVAILLMVQLATRGATRARLLGLGLVCGLAALSKVSDLGLLPLALLTTAWLAWKRRDRRLFVNSLVLIGIPALAVAGWWYARNTALYGDPLAFNVWLQVAGGRPPVTLPGLLPEFQGFRISFWGNFGGVNLIAAGWVYTLLDIVSVAGVIGLLAGLWRKTLPAAMWVPAAWVAIVMASLVRWTLMTYASQGRLAFPAISAFAVLLAIGLAEFGRMVASLISRRAVNAERLERLAADGALAVPVLWLVGFAVLAPFLIIAPAYQLPSRLDATAEAPNPVHIRYEAGGARPELVGYEVGRTVKPGDELPLTVYWRSDTPIDTDLTVYIHLFDASGEPLGQWDALPGNGLYPTRLWKPGQLIVDRYRVPVSMLATGPQVGRVEVGLTPLGSAVPLVARDPAGKEIEPIIGQFKIPAPATIGSLRPPLFKLGDEFEVVSMHLGASRGGRAFEVDPETRLFAGDVLKFQVTLRAVRVPSENYTVFVHLLAPDGHIVVQRDEQPLGGAYATSFWDAGEQVANEYELTVPTSAPAGQYALEFGMYGPDNVRLRVSGSDTANPRAAGDRILYSGIEIGR